MDAAPQIVLPLPPEEALAGGAGEVEWRQQAFLHRLHSGKRYKRFLGAPIRYGGGKSLAVGQIVERIPADAGRLVAPFVGGGSVEVACAQLGLPVVAYDVFAVLAAYWQVQLQQPRALAERLGTWQPTAECYRQVKEVLRAHWLNTRRLPPLELAAHYFFNHNLSYGPGFLGWMSTVYACPKRYASMLARVGGFSAPGMQVECADFRESMPRHRHDFLYCDPPYYLDGDSKMFRGIYPQRNFPIHHKGFDHAALRDLLRAHRGGFLLSYNDCSTIRDWYQDFEISELHWQYTMGQGETRIGFNRLEEQRGHVKSSHELLIFGWRR